MIRLRAISALLCLIVAAVAAAGPSSDELRQDAIDAFARNDFAAALEAYRAMPEVERRDGPTLYNMACAHAMLGDEDAAAERLLDAISWGFVDLFHMTHDDHLDPLRDHPEYRRILAGWNELLDSRGEADRDVLRDHFGEGYRYEADEQLRLSYASAFEPYAHEDAVKQIEGVAAWAEELGLFNADEEIQPTREDPWVMVILPTTRDFQLLTRGVQIGGFYDRDRKRLVSRDIGPSLRHEFFHVLHWRDMDRRGQRHPLWIQEGLAAILEDVVGEAPPDGEGWTPAPSWRTNIVRRLEKGGALAKWRLFFEFDDRRFMNFRPSANYAQARAVFLYLLSEGKLVDWYRAYVAGFDEDASGVVAMEQAFGKPLRDVERDYRAWVRSIPEVAEIARPGDASLGLQIGPGAGDGPVVAQVVAGSGRGGVGAERLRRRDVITAVDGETVRTLDDLYRVLGEFEPGDEVALSVRRSGEPLEIRVRLVPHRNLLPQ
ncbi:MAG: PDZ domain-containing protein [Phycisphaerales bacterium]